MDQEQRKDMTSPSYRALRIVLLVLTIVLAGSGLLAIFGGKTLMMRAFLHPPANEVSNLFLMMMKQMGGLFLMLSLMLYATFRDPVRNIAILDALLVGMIILAFTPLLSVYTLTLWPPYTISGLWLCATCFLTKPTIAGRCVARASARILVAERGGIRDLESGKAVERVRVACRPRLRFLRNRSRAHADRQTRKKYKKPPEVRLGCITTHFNA